MDNIILHFQHLIAWLITGVNQVGVDTSASTEKRDIPTPGGDIAYVRKHGLLYPALNISAGTTKGTDTGGGQTLRFKFYGITSGTLLYTINDVNGGVGGVDPGDTLDSAEGIKCVISCEAGAGVTIANGRQITVVSDVDGGGKVFYFGGETLDNGESITVYLSNTGSTYYSDDYIHGGFRHTPALNDLRLTYFDPITALAALQTANDDGIEIVDSKIYDILPDIAFSQIHLYATDGQAPTLTRGVGARITREVSTHFDNFTAVFFNENGTNVTTGVGGYRDSWQDPYGTFANAQIAAAAKGVILIIYGGTGATVSGGNFSGAQTCSLANGNLEPEYGYKPNFLHTATVITITSAGFDINGVSVNGNNLTRRGIDISINDSTNILSNLSITNNAEYGIFGDNSFKGRIYNSEIYSNGSKGIYLKDDFGGGGIDGRIYDNIIYNNGGNGIDIENKRANSSNVIINNLIYNNIGSGIKFLTSGGTPHSGEIENNTCWGNSYGINYAENGTFTGNIRDNICWNNTIFDMILTAGAIAIDYNNYLTNSGFTPGVNDINTDPKFCKESLPYKFGISADSGAHKTDSSGDDMGAHFRIIEINESDIEITGINFDGQEQYNNAIFIADGVDHTGLIIKWCNVFDFQGIPIDPYDDDANTNCIISNNKIHNNGNGLKLSRGGNTVEYNLIYNNTAIGIWSDYAIQTFNHNICFGNKYSFYFETNTASIIIKNCILHGNSFGIHSEIAIAIKSCCITDAYTSNVDVTDESNVLDSPNFINTTVGSEDFNIKTKAGGYNFDSPCLDAADDGYDIGAYLLTRVISNDSRKMYQLANDPTTMDRVKKCIDQTSSRHAQGRLSLYGKAHKFTFPLIWGDEEYSTEDQYDILEYISTLIQTLENEITKEETLIRCLLLPDTHYETGTAATISAALKTIVLSTKSWIWNKFKGWWADIHFVKSESAGTEIFYAGNEDGGFEQIFYAGMEIDLTEWDSFSTNNGAVTRDTPGLNGTLGKMKCNIPAGAGGNYARGNSGNKTISENIFELSFYLNVDSLTMGAGDAFLLLQYVENGVTLTGTIEIYNNAGQYQMQIFLSNDALAMQTTGVRHDIPSGDVLIKIIYYKATGAAANNGGFAFYMNRTLIETKFGIDIFTIWTAIKSFNLGFVAGVDATTLDSLFIDEVYIKETANDLSEWTSKVAAGGGGIARATPGLDNTIGKMVCSFLAGGAGDTSYGLKNIAINYNDLVYSYYINVSDLIMGDTDSFSHCKIYELAGAILMVITLKYTTADGYQIKVDFYNDAVAVGGSTGFYAISSTVDSLVQVVMHRASSATANNASASLYIDRVLKETITGVDMYDEWGNMNRINHGGYVGVDAGTAGNLYIDEVNFVEGDAILIDATHKTAMIPNAKLIPDAWIGYVLYINHRYYYILDNETDMLLLSDPDDTLVSEVITDWKIQQSFRIIKNDKSELTVLDPEGLLISGSYDFVIDFVEMVVQDSVFGGRQLRGFDFENKEEMTGYAIVFEES